MKKMIIIICLFCLQTVFQTVFADGTCGTNVNYKINGNTIIFSGTDSEATWDNDCKSVINENPKITILKIANSMKINIFSSFSDLKNITEMDLSKLDITDKTDMTGMFSNCKALKSLSLNRWDVSNVTHMPQMFWGCESLTDLKISYWDTSNVKDMSEMFANCFSLTNLYVQNWDVAKVIKMDAMFSGCESLTTLDVSNWDISNVTSMTSMFVGCSALTNLDVSNWDTSIVTSMGRMFSGCESLTTLDVTNWDTSKVTYMTDMFENCSVLTNLDVSNWDTSKVARMEGMFSGCESLTTLDVSNWDTSKVIYMSTMFSGCKSLTTLDLNSWNISNVTSMEGMFSDCGSLTTLDVSNWDTSNVIYIGGMFSDCGSLKTLDVSNWDTSNVTSMTNMFWGCSALTTLNVSNWDTSKVVTSMGGMFSGCESLTTLDVNNWDTSNVTSMHYMFYGCYSLTNMDISNWDTSNVNNMDRMFSDCGSLTTLDVSNWDTSNVTKMNGMFSDCRSLTNLDLSSWNTINVEKSTNILGTLVNVKTITLGKNTLNSNIFTNCYSDDVIWYYVSQGKEAKNPLPLLTTLSSNLLFTSYNSDSMAGTWSMDGSFLGLYKSSVNGKVTGNISTLQYNDGNLLQSDKDSSDEFFLHFLITDNDKETLKETITLPDGLSFSNTKYEKNKTVSVKQNTSVSLPVYSVYHIQDVDHIKIEIKGDKNMDLIIPVTQGKGVVKVELSFSSRGDTYAEPISNIGLNWGTVPKGRYDKVEALMALHMSSVNMSRSMDSLHNLGFSNIIKHDNKLEGNHNFSLDPFGCGYFIAQKKIPAANGQIKTIIAVLIRGTAGSFADGEWIGNFLNAISDDETLKNTFYTSAETIYDEVLTYVHNHNIPMDSAVRFVCGYSRGAAAAGILTHMFNEKYGEADTVGYTFATPNNKIDMYAGANDNNIYNYMYAHDVVPYVPQGHEKLGTTWVVGTAERPEAVAQIYNNYTLRNNKIPNNAILIELIINANQDLNHRNRSKSIGSQQFILKELVLSEIIADLGGKLFETFGIPHSVENYLSWLKGYGVKIDPDYQDYHNYADNDSSDFIRFVRDYLYDISQEAKNITYEYHIFKLLHKTFLNELRKQIVTLISCPVDVKVYDSNGISVASIIDHQIEFVTERDDFFAFTDGENDYVYFPDNSGYHVEITGNDDGQMKVETSIYDQNLAKEDSVSFTGVSVRSNEQFSLNIVDEDLEKSTLTSEGIEDPGSSTKVFITDQDILNRTIDLGTTGEDWEKLTYQLGAVVRPSDKNQDVIWRSSDPTIAVVDETGLVTGLKTGTVTITAAAKDGSDAYDSIQLNIVTNIQLGNLLINGLTPVGIGCSIDLDAMIDQTVKPENQNLIWTSNNPEIASVDQSGQVTGITEGTAVITVCPTGSEKYCTSFEIEVMKKTTKLDILNKDAVIITGMSVSSPDDFFQLKARPKPYSASNSFIWSSSDTNIAEVNETGGVSFKKEGTVTITVTATDGSNQSAWIELSNISQTVCQIGDLDCDGEVGMSDLILFIHVLLDDPIEIKGSADFDNNGVVDMGDLITMIHLILGDPIN